MPFLKIPPSISTSKEAHQKWLKIIQEAQTLIDEDIDLQDKSAKFLRLKERYLAPEVLGRNYAQYCSLINQMYDAYLNSVHMQRSQYMMEIISVILKRLYELRNELVHLIVNDYIYIDTALIQQRMTPDDIQIIVPYHIPLESRAGSMEQLLQKMWAEAVKRKNTPPVVVKPVVIGLGGSEESFAQESFRREPSEEPIPIEESVHTIIPEEYIQMCIIQKHERFRQYYMEAFGAACRRRRMYFADKVVEAPMNLKIRAASFIQRVYRNFMMVKRERVRETKRDILLGLIPDPYREKLDYDEENTKMYHRRKMERLKIEEAYKRDKERENSRLLLFKKENQIEDITVQVWEWFREWYYGYGFFPEYPYTVEGGTMIVMTGEFQTIEEQFIADEKYNAATKGKTKEQLKQEKDQAKADAALKAEVEKENRKKEAEQAFKNKCDPFTDPGYQVQKSEAMGDIADAFRKYRLAWSLYDRFPADTCAETIYGYIQPMLTEDLMFKIHKDCRKYVDELMRLDLKLLIKVHQAMYKEVGWKYPKQRARKMPKFPPVPKPLKIDSNLLSSLEEVFDLGIMTKPTSKIKDIFGDLNYAAYDLNVRDPNASFPPPGYGDVRRRLLLSCVFSSGIEPGAKRNKSVLLVGPPKNGKSFLVDCVAGEMNALKIDISPEVFSAVVDRPASLLSRVFLAAKVFQPAVIYCRDMERVFAKKVPPQDRMLKAGSIKAVLPKLIKQILNDDKVIFIEVCNDDLVAFVNLSGWCGARAIVCSAYLPGERDDPTEDLARVVDYAARNNAELLVGCDANAHHTAWGSTNINSRATTSYPYLAQDKPMVALFNELLLVPRMDYGSLQNFFYNKLQSIRSMPRDYCVQALAVMLQGYGSGTIVELFRRVMCEERIVQLNITPLSAIEFIQPLIEEGIEPVTMEEYQTYINFCLENSSLYQERKEYEIINSIREILYTKKAEKDQKAKSSK